MRRTLILSAAFAASVLTGTATTADQRIYAAPKAAPAAAAPPTSRVVRAQGVAPAVPAKPGSVGFYRDPLYADSLVHPGFYGGFDRYGTVLPRSHGGALGGGLIGGQGDTNVDVDVRTGRGGSAPVVVAPQTTPNRSGEVAALRRENWKLRRSIAPDLAPLGQAASGTGKGSAELRELIGAIIARRDRQWQEKISGARVVAVDDLERELGEARREVRRLERRERNPHILYLGFDD